MQYFTGSQCLSCNCEQTVSQFWRFHVENRIYEFHLFLISGLSEGGGDCCRQEVGEQTSNLVACVVVHLPILDAGNKTTTKIVLTYFSLSRSLVLLR